MEPVTTTTSSTVVSPALLVAGGIVIGATAATVVIKYNKEIKAAGVSIADKAKSLFGKKAPQPAAEATAPTPVVEPTPAAEPAVIQEFIIKLEPVVVAEAPVVVAEAPVVVAEVPVVVAEAPVVVAEAPITVEQVESVAKLAELLSPASTTTEVAEPVTGDDLTAKVLSASITEENRVSDIVLLTKEVAAGIAEAMTQLPQQQRVQQPYRHNKRHHQRR